MSLILVIDDEADIRDAVAEFLGAEGYEVATATDGESALAYLRTGVRPAVILLDLMMPVMSGLQFLEAQRTDSQLQDIPVIAFSAAGAAVAETAVRICNTAAFVSKPFELGGLLQAVRAHDH